MGITYSFINRSYRAVQTGLMPNRFLGPRWQSGNTLASHLCGRGSIPAMAVSGKAGSCLPLVGSLQFTVQNPSELYVLVSSALPTTRRDMTCTLIIICTICLIYLQGHGGPHSPPTSEVGGSNPRPYVGKLLVVY